MRQAGYVFRKGDSWFVRYRESLVEGGQVVKNQRCKKLSDVAPEDMRLTRAPDSVLLQAEEFLRPVNIGNLTPGTNIPLGEFIEKVYFVNKKNEHRASTINGYKQRWNSLLAPRCKNVRLREFD